MRAAASLWVSLVRGVRLINPRSNVGDAGACPFAASICRSRRSNPWCWRRGRSPTFILRHRGGARIASLYLNAPPSTTRQRRFASLLAARRAARQDVHACARAAQRKHRHADPAAVVHIIREPRATRKRVRFINLRKLNEPDPYVYSYQYQWQPFKPKGQRVKEGPLPAGAIKAKPFTMQ